MTCKHCRCEIVDLDGELGIIWYLGERVMFDIVCSSNEVDLGGGLATFGDHEPSKNSIVIDILKDL